MIREYIPSFIVLILVMLAGAGIGVSVGNEIWGSNTSIAPIYALDCIVDTSKVGATSICYPAGEFSVFWQDTTKNTTFTVDDKPVQITDVQVFYRTDSHCTISDTGIGTILYDCKCYKNGNITYYPQGIENSQTGDCDFDTLALMPTPALTPTPILAFPYEFCANGCLICTDHLGNCTYIPGRPTPTPAPTYTCENK